MRTKTAGVLSWLCTAMAVMTGAAQQPAQPPRTGEGADVPVVRISTDYVLLDVLVEDKKTHQLVGNLESRDFQVEEDGARQTVTSFSLDLLPLSVVFLFDLTQTVHPILKPLADGATEILGHLKPQDEVAVMAFSSHTELLQGFTLDRRLAGAAIETASQMASKEATFLHEDMWEALDQALKAQTPKSRKVLVWLTDGTSNFDNLVTRKAFGKQAPAHLHGKEEATAKLLHTDVAVAALVDRSILTDALITYTDANPLSALGGGRFGEIDNYAAMTGGPALKTSKKEVAQKLAQLIDELRGRYEIGYRPPQAEGSVRFRAVKVSLTDEALRRLGYTRESELTVRARRGYFR